MHPSSLDAGTLWLSATASEVIRFNLADVEYRHVFSATTARLPIICGASAMRT